MNWLESLLFISASVLSEVKAKKLRDGRNSGWQEEEGGQAKQAQNNQAEEQAIIYSLKWSLIVIGGGWVRTRKGKQIPLEVFHQISNETFFMVFYSAIL